MKVFSFILALGAFFSPAALAGPIDACLADAMLPNQINCLLDLALEEDSPDACLQSTEVAVRMHCVSLFAERADRRDACERLEDSGAASPRTLCRAHLAIAWREPETCAALAPSELADACHMKLGELEGDPAFCVPIVNQTLRETCLEISQPQ